jgi:hypothetical protein
MENKFESLGMDYEAIYLQVAQEFHDKYIVHPDRETVDTLAIAMEYTQFIIDRCDELTADMYFTLKGLENEPPL